MSLWFHRDKGIYREGLMKMRIYEVFTRMTARDSNERIDQTTRANVAIKRLWIILTFALFLTLGLLTTTDATASWTVTPRLSIHEQYDDNLDLEPENENSDWITVISPGISLELETPNTTSTLDYEAGFSFYADDSSRNSTSHQGQVEFDQDLSRHLRFHLSDTFIRSDDPVVETEGEIEDIRRERGIYFRNASEASLSYDFGVENVVTAGYRNLYLDDRSSANEDSVGHEGFVNLDTWFTPRFGIGITALYNQSRFEHSDDFDQYAAGLTVNYRWQEARRVYARYDLLYQDFEPSEADDYRVHESALGVSLALGAHTDLNLEGGYFIQDYLNGDQTEGAVFTGTLSTRLERTSLSLTGGGGYDQDYYSAENLGPSKFQEVSGSADYLLTENLNIFASASYRWEDFLETEDDRTEDDRTDEVWRATGGLSFSFWRWLTLSLEGTHLERGSSDSTEEFKDNRVMLRLTWAYPYSI